MANVSMRFIEPKLLEELKTAYKQNRLTLSEIRAYAKSEMAEVYNHLLIHLENSEIRYDKELIINKDYVHNLISDKQFPVFTYLKQCGYVYPCGSGYLFEKPRIQLSEEESAAVEKIVFKQY